MTERARREQAYWDEAYRPNGREHEKYLWATGISDISYVGHEFRSHVAGLRKRRILSVGAGVDKLGVSLARAGNTVVTLDVSSTAAARTRDLAEQAHVGHTLTCIVGPAEDVALEARSFDVVLCKRSLHHMDLYAVVPRVHELLVPGGVLVAEEPVCLSKALRWLHAKVPFHPEAPRTPDERELTEEDLAFVARTFRQFTISYFDLLARESCAYLLSRLHLENTLWRLGKLDHSLLNRRLPVLRRFSTYVVFQARK